MRSEYEANKQCARWVSQEECERVTGGISVVFGEKSRKAKVKQEYVVFNLLPRQVWHSDVKKLRRRAPAIVSSF